MLVNIGNYELYCGINETKNEKCTNPSEAEFYVESNGQIKIGGLILHFLSYGPDKFYRNTFNMNFQIPITCSEQLLFEQFIRGLPRFVYENIRTSPDVKTT